MTETLLTLSALTLGYLLGMRTGRCGCGRQTRREADERLAAYERERGRRRGAGEQGLMREIV